MHSKRGRQSAGEAGGSEFFPTNRGRESGGAAVLVDALDRRVIDANVYGAELLGRSAAELAGESFADLIEPHRIDDGADGGAPAGYRFAGRDGEAVFYGLSVAEVAHRSRRALLYLFHDVTGWVDHRTDLTNRNLELAHLARHDHLTNLFNRLMFRDTLELANARLGRVDGCLGVLYIDLDRFKGVNDRFGHNVGDAVLVEVARRLREGIRTSDVAARLGGDEFGVILENLRAPEDALKVATHLVESIGEPFSPDGKRVRISASIGAAVTDRPVADVAALVTTADKTMFRAKSDGRGSAALSADIGPRRIDQPVA